MTTDIRPLVFGYLRVLPGMGIDHVIQVHRQLTTLAAARGFVLGNVFVEAKWQQLTWWVTLCERGKRDGVCNVAVPAPRLWFVEPSPKPAEQEAHQ